MATVMEREELSLPVDWDVLDACPGFSFDMGGSVMKLAYIAKKDYIEPANRDKDSKGLLRIIKFSREEIDEAFEFIKENVHIKRQSTDGIVSVYSTGLGGTQLSDRFNKLLNVKNYQLPEFECFMKYVTHVLGNVPREEVLLPIDRPAFKDARKQIAIISQSMKRMKHLLNVKNIEEIDGEKELPQELDDPNKGKPYSEDLSYPYGFVICGSGFGILCVNKDGTYNFVEGSVRSGRTFAGLGSVLTGAKNYRELLELCENGKSNNVNTTLKNVNDGFQQKKKKGNDDVYKWFGDDSQLDVPLFCFGQGVGKTIGDFRKEDMARSVLEMTILDLVQLTHLTAKRYKLKQIFFCGGFVSHPLVRHLLTIEWLKRDCGHRIYVPDDDDYIPVHFLKGGERLGVIGALFNHKYKWIKMNMIPDDTDKQNNNSK